MLYLAMKMRDMMFLYLRLNKVHVTLSFQHLGHFLLKNLVKYFKEFI